MDAKAFWGRVKKLIKAHNSNQKLFAEYINIPLNTLKSWIYYDRVPDVGTAYSIAEALGVQLDYLVHNPLSVYNPRTWQISSISMSTPIFPSQTPPFR